MYVHICICIYIYVYIHICIRIHTCRRSTYIYYIIYICMYVYTLTHTHAHRSCKHTRSSRTCAKKWSISTTDWRLESVRQRQVSKVRYMILLFPWENIIYTTTDWMLESLRQRPLFSKVRYMKLLFPWEHVIYRKILFTQELHVSASILKNPQPSEFYTVI
jgi:hypothetical protein